MSSLTQKNKTCKRALELYDRGYSIIPLNPDSKKPKLESWKQYQTERPSREKVKKWFSEPANIGIITGQVSNLLVLDLDSQDAIKWAKSHEFSGVTPSVITHRGYHLYFEYPEDVELDSASYEPYPKAEVFGNAHYVVAPPSRHPSGFQYRWDVSPTQTSPEPAPEWLLNELRPQTKPRGGTVKETAKNSSEGKVTVNVEDLKAPTVNEGLKREILKDPILEGQAKNGSNNGRYISYLITHYNLGSSKTEACKDTLERYPELERKEVEESAKTVWKQGYGLKPAVMAGFDGVTFPQALAFTHRVAGATEWRTHTSKNLQMSPREVEARIFTGALVFNGKTMTTRQFSELIGVKFDTLKNRRQDDRLPKLVQIEPINGVGIKVTNLLPYLIITITTVRHNTYTNPLSSIVVKGVGPLGVESIEGGSRTGPLISEPTQDKRAPP